MPRWTTSHVLLFGARVALALGLMTHVVSAQQLRSSIPPSQTPEVGSPANTVVAYQVDVQVDDSKADLIAALKESSVLATHAKKGVPDKASLMVRARTDEKQLLATLYAEARYAATVNISIGGKPLDAIDITNHPAANQQPLSVAVAITAGPEFRFGNVSVGQTKPTDVKPIAAPQDVGLITGEPARSAIIVAAVDKIIQQWRSAGFPFASISKKEITADHARNRVDVALMVDPGAPATYGWINVVGAKKLSNETVAGQSALVSGERYNPKDLAKTRERLRKLESVESVQIIEGKKLDRDGSIPITLAIKERKQRYIGVTASVTTLDGAEVKGHWGHRNLFGEGEHLRVEGAVSQLGTAPLDEMEFDVSATLTKPGVLDIDTNLFTQFRIAREANDVYLSDMALAKVGLTRRYNDYLSGSLATEVRYINEDDEFGKSDYTLFSLPGDVTYDTRNNRFDPSKGVHAKLRGTPAVDVSNATSFLSGELDVASYWSLDSAARAVFAARIRAGTVLGASLQNVPASYRFLAGGGNSVRGYEYRSLGPSVAGRTIGGLSFASTSLELRFRPTKQIGVVPFVDVATVSVDRIPSFSDTVYVGAGLGFRYYTALGPIRIDAAVPLTNRENRSKFGVYVGLGQAF